MRERRFVVKEVPPTGAPHDFSITESEFKKRIQAIDLLNDLDECIDILLNGEREQPPAGLFHGPGLPIRDMDGDLISPLKPTRKEWEEWIDRMPYANILVSVTITRQLYKRWFLTMPGVPPQNQQNVLNSAL